MLEDPRRAESGMIGPSVALRAGVALPDWSAIRSAAAFDVVCAILDVFDITSRWRDRSVEEDRVHRALLRAWGRHGRAPETAELAADTGMPPDAVRAMLGRLHERDLVVLNEAGDAIVGAYPFSARETGHGVRVGARWLNAMCAIDALGVGAMYGADTRIETRCRACDATIRIETRGGGVRLGAVSPEGALVWSGVRYEDGCAATSLCTVIAFFCRADHLAAWREENEPETQGYTLSLDEALQAGRGLFGPLLAENRADSRMKGRQQ
jgi:hypothetical protein